MTETLSQTITRLRKEGNLIEAWELACPAIEKTPSDIYLQQAFFWLCYDRLKKEIYEPLKKEVDEGGDNFYSNEKALNKINYFLDWIEWINIEPDERNYRNLLLASLKFLPYVPRLVLMLLQYLDYLFGDDHRKPFITDKGNELPSLMLKFTRIVTKLWFEEKLDGKVSVDNLLSLIDKTKSEVEDRQAIVWLDYDRANCLITVGRKTDARKSALSVLQRKQTEPWAWHVLGRTYVDSDSNSATVLLSKAICVSHKDSFELPILKDLALILAEQGYKREASMCVKRIVGIYENNSWKLKAEYKKLLDESWFVSGVSTDSLDTFLKEKSETASQMLYGETISILAVVEHIHNSNKGFNVFISRDESIPIPVSLMKPKELPSIGDFVRLTVTKQDRKPVSGKICKADIFPDVEIQEGRLKIHIKGFGFVNNTFIPPNLVEHDVDGADVRVLAIYQFNRKREKYSWKALRLIKS